VIVCTARARLSSSRLPYAYTMVLTPSATATSAGPISTGSVVPAAATPAEMVPAGRLRMASSGLTRAFTTGAPPARMSTAGAAAVWRTVRRPWPGAVREMSFVKRVAVASPAGVRCATAV
jgi:hypothetical protein